MLVIILEVNGSCFFFLNWIKQISVNNLPLPPPLYIVEQNFSFDFTDQNEHELGPLAIITRKET